MTRYPSRHRLSLARCALGASLAEVTKLTGIWATDSPFDLKDVLKARGYRWNDGADGRPKAWWIDVLEENLAVERAFLRTEVYG